MLADNFADNSNDRIVLGIDGRINDDWTWDAYYTYGVANGSLTMGGNNPLSTSFFYAVDAVRDPNGNIVPFQAELSQFDVRARQLQPRRRHERLLRGAALPEHHQRTPKLCRAGHLYRGDLRLTRPR